MTSIKSALERRLAEGKKEEGFSLIELLVVVIIIGILAAIAIPIYIGVQDNAKDSAVKSDLTNAKLAVIAYYTDKGASAAAPSLNATSLGYVRLHAELEHRVDRVQGHPVLDRLLHRRCRRCRRDARVLGLR